MIFKFTRPYFQVSIHNQNNYNFFYSENNCFQSSNNLRPSEAKMYLIKWKSQRKKLAALIDLLIQESLIS